MNILIVNFNNYISNEISDFARQNNCKIFIAESNNEAAKILNKYRIDLAIISKITPKNSYLITYINQNYQHIKIILDVDDQWNNIFNIIRNGNYQISNNSNLLTHINTLIKQIK